MYPKSYYQEFFIPIDDISNDVEESHNSKCEVPNLRIEVDHTPRKDTDYSKTVVSLLSSDYSRLVTCLVMRVGRKGKVR